jgi:hypothetical protein
MVQEGSARSATLRGGSLHELEAMCDEDFIALPRQGAGQRIADHSRLLEACFSDREHLVETSQDVEINLIAIAYVLHPHPRREVLSFRSTNRRVRKRDDSRGSALPAGGD